MSLQKRQRLSAGEVNVLSLSSHDRLAYVRAMQALKPTGVPLEMAAMQFAQAQSLLEGGSLLAAANAERCGKFIGLPPTEIIFPGKPPHKDAMAGRVKQRYTIHASSLCLASEKQCGLTSAAAGWNLC